VHAGGDDRSPLAGLSGCVNIFNLVPPSENSLNEAMGERRLDVVPAGEMDQDAQRFRTQSDSH